MQAIVRTKEELEKAIESKIDTIIVTGPLANDVIKAQKIKKIGKVACASLGVATSAIIAAVAAAPATGGISGIAALAPVAAASTLTGLEIATIIFACTMGVAVLIAFYKNYDMIEMSLENGEPKVVFKKNHNTSNEC